MPETRFDEWIAAHYATLWPELFEPEVLVPTVDFLAALAGGGPCLEFGAGTGRVAVPLSGRGVPVTGIELSPRDGRPTARSTRSRRRTATCGRPSWTRWPRRRA